MLGGSVFTFDSIILSFSLAIAILSLFMFNISLKCSTHLSNCSSTVVSIVFDDFTVPFCVTEVSDFLVECFVVSFHRRHLCLFRYFFYLIANL
jgi:hypothetical protein